MKKYNCINLFRFIMALCVISIHTHPLENVNNEYIINFNESVVRLAVPFFFLTTGFFIGKKMKDINNYSKEENNIIKNSCNKNIKYFIIFTIIYLPITLYYYFTSDNSILHSCYNFVQGLFLTGEHYNSWILWYLLSTIYGLALIKILNKNNLNIKKIITIGLILYIFGYLINILTITNTDISILKILKKIINYTILSGRVFTSVIYLSIGMYISKKERNINGKISIILLIILILCNTFTFDMLDEVFILPSSIILFTIVINIDLKDNKIYDTLKYLSNKMYFWHLYIYTIICLIINKGSIDHLYGFNYFAVCTIITIILSIIMNKIKLNMNNNIRYNKNN